MEDMINLQSKKKKEVDLKQTDDIVDDEVAGKKKSVYACACCKLPREKKHPKYCNLCMLKPIKICFQCNKSHDLDSIEEHFDPDSNICMKCEVQNKLRIASRANNKRKMEEKRGLIPPLKFQLQKSFAKRQKPTDVLDLDNINDVVDSTDNLHTHSDDELVHKGQSLITSLLEMKNIAPEKTCEVRLSFAFNL